MASSQHSERGDLMVSVHIRGSVPLTTDSLILMLISDLVSFLCLWLPQPCICAHDPSYMQTPTRKGTYPPLPPKRQNKINKGEEQ